ncbi:hypothetical protein [Mesorhizobium sp. CAU 1732]|uniref:hypothetical protein n=1 Tax=Mesorhizobium sp. CAU 1732 TaxID=3140358 RepID=UPI00326196B7
MNLSKLFQKVKHNSYRPSKREHEQIEAFLRDESSHLDIDAHTAIYIFCLTSPATETNIILIRRFLSEDADDYVRAAAIVGLFVFWEVSSSDLREQLLKMLEGARDSIESDSAAALMRAGTRTAIINGQAGFSAACGALLEAAYERMIRSENNEDRFFISFCGNIYNSWERNNGKPISYISTVDEALEIYHDRDNYLPRLVS